MNYFVWLSGFVAILSWKYFWEKFSFRYVCFTNPSSQEKQKILQPEVVGKAEISFPETGRAGSYNTVCGLWPLVAMNLNRKIINNIKCFPRVKIEQNIYVLDK